MKKISLLKTKELVDSRNVKELVGLLGLSITKDNLIIIAKAISKRIRGEV